MTKDTSCATMSPWSEYDPMTGYFYLTNGAARQIICRFDGENVYVWWKRDKGEHPIPIEEWQSVFTTT